VGFKVGLTQCKVLVEPLPRNVLVAAQLQNRREMQQVRARPSIAVGVVE
jgi:hypothetical protein